MSKKIIIYGAYDDGNFGDDLLLFVILDWLKKNNSLKNVFVSSSNLNLKKNNDSINLLDKHLAKHQTCDLFILGGGTQFFSFKKDDKPLNSNIFNKIKKVIKNPILLYFNLKSLINIKTNQKSKIAIGIGLGPFENQKKLNDTINVLKFYDKIYVRDYKSKSICNENGIESYEGSDICFSDFFVNKYRLIHIKTNEKKPKIGIVLRDWSHSQIGSSINCKIINWINKNKDKFTISIFLFSKTKDNTLHLKLIKDTNIYPNVWDLKVMEVSDYLNKINEMDVFISSRFHSGVVNANLGIPTICLGIDPKLLYLVESVNGFYHLSNDENFGVITKYIEEILNNYKQKQIDIIESKKILNSKANLIFKKATKCL